MVSCSRDTSLRSLENHWASNRLFALLAGGRGVNDFLALHQEFVVVMSAPVIVSMRRVWASLRSKVANEMM